MPAHSLNPSSRIFSTALGEQTLIRKLSDVCYVCLWVFLFSRRHLKLIVWSGGIDIFPFRPSLWQTKAFTSASIHHLNLVFVAVKKSETPPWRQPTVLQTAWGHATPPPPPLCLGSISAPYVPPFNAVHLCVVLFFVGCFRALFWRPCSVWWPDEYHNGSSTTAHRVQYQSSQCSEGTIIW